MIGFTISLNFWDLVAGILLFSVLVPLYFFWAAQRRTQRIERLVTERTNELAQTNEELAREVARRRRTEEALTESEDRLRVLFEYAPDAYWLVNRKGTLIDGNRAAEDAFGCSKEEFVGRSFQDLHLLSADDLRRAALLLSENAIENPAGPIEWTLRRRNNTVLVVETRTYPVRHQDQTLILAISRDVSERKRAEEEKARLETQMRNAQKLESLGVMAGGIAHDFNNLLMGVLGHVGLAQRKLAPASPVQSNLEKIEQSALRAAELTRQMLVYCGKGRMVVQPLNLSSLVKGAYRLFEASAPKKVSFRYELEDGLPDMKGDPGQIRQVLVNLAVNAWEAVGEGRGEIAIRTGAMHVDRRYLAETHLDDDLPEGEYVYIEVSDNGCGMDEETRSRIFDPFFSTKFPGRGMGLAAGLGIVRAHCGAIRVATQPGRGSTFRALFPSLPRAPETSAKTAPAPGARPEHATVLVVDDEEMVRSAAADMLGHSGFTVLTAADGVEAVDLFRRNAARIGVVLLDLTMPRMDGREAFRRLRELRPDATVILSSGYSEQEAADQFGGEGLAGFIHKPYTWDSLLATIREALTATQTAA
ncbi:MAG: response regulator [Candidatus Sumerlaeota bacterium]|nr:response regulator [Candidatus Sumerlaeota bacterium]